MDAVTRTQILAGLDARDVEVNVRAATQIHKQSIKSDIPWLLEALKHESFFVRESAAWPLAELAGPSALPELFAAYQRGFDDGYDNDGFTAALIELAALHPLDTPPALQQLVAEGNEAVRGHAAWLLEFCEPPETQPTVQADGPASGGSAA